MTKLEELQKAIEEVAEAGTGLLRKSQMALDFSAPNPHHVAYTRTNASGTVSQIQAKGSPKVEIKRVSSDEQNVSQRHISYDIHVDGKYHTTHNDINDAMDHKERLEKEGQAKPSPKPNATTNHSHYPWGRLTKVDGGGITAIMHPEHQEAVGKLQDGESTSFKDEQGIDWKAKRDGEHVKMTPPPIHSSKSLVVKHSDLAPEDISYDPQPGDDAPLKNPEARYQNSHQQLIDGVHKVGNDLLANPKMAEHHSEIETMLVDLERVPDAKHAMHIANRLKEMTESKISKPAATKARIKDHPMYTGSDYNHLKGKGYDDTEIKNIWDRDQKSGNDPLVHKKAPDVTGVVGNPDFYRQNKPAAKDLKAELESDDFGMTEKGGNGRVKMHKDGTVSVYDSYFAGGDQALENHKAKWSPGGTYHNYFKDKGYNLEVVGSDKDHNSNVFGVKQGRLGHVAVTLKVSKP